MEFVVPPDCFCTKGARQPSRGCRGIEYQRLHRPKVGDRREEAERPFSETAQPRRAQGAGSGAVSGRVDFEDAEAAIRQLLLRPVVATDAGLLLEALPIKTRYQLSYWDAAIVGAVRMLGAATLYTEDLNDCQEYGGVRAVNPFGSAA